MSRSALFWSGPKKPEAMKTLHTLALVAGIAAATIAGSLRANAQDKAVDVAKIGGPIINVDVHDIDGNFYSLNDFVGKDGKYLLINFWTANCPRCHAGFVELKKYNDKFADKLNIVSVMLSDNYQGWLDMYAHKKPFAWPNLSDGKSLADGPAKNYNISLYPTYVLVSPDGKILDQWSGFNVEKFTEKIKPYFSL